MFISRKNFIKAEILTPDAQATVDAYADVAGSKIDTGLSTSVAIVLKNTHGSKSLDFKVLASIDDATYIEVQAEETVTFGNVGTAYSVAQATYRYYKVQVKSTAGGQPSEATLHAIAK